MDVLPEQSISRAFLLYPDPWPKARHHRRRFVTPEHLEPLARVLKPGAMALQVTLRPASSRAMDLARPMRPALEAA